jgi:hypothetical protein
MLISSAIPQNTTAGELILYRHLSQVPELNLIIATDKYAFSSDEDPLDIQVNRFIIRLQKTRFSRFVNDVHQCLHPFFNYDKLRKSIAKHKPDLILTVAEGTYWIAAQRMAREFNIPLVSIFHDWWPDLAYVHSWARRILENRFKQLYRQSQLAFCVSEEMRQLLGTHPNAQLLYPIPDQLVAAAETHTLSTGKQFKLVYAGRLSGISGQTIQALCTSLQGVTGLQLKLFGPQPDWSDAFLQPLKEQGIYGGFISRDRLRQEFNAASALLVAIPFDGFQPPMGRDKLSFKVGRVLQVSETNHYLGTRILFRCPLGVQAPSGVGGNFTLATGLKESGQRTRKSTRGAEASWE